MPRAMQVISGFVTAPGASLTAWTLGSGDQLAVANATAGTDIRLATFWAQNQAAGILRIRSPLFHDNVNGIQARVVASNIFPLIEEAPGQVLYPNDLLQVSQSGSAGAGKIETGSLLLMYDDLPGSMLISKSWPEVQPRIESYMYVTNSLTLGAGGGYTGAQALTATDNQWKALRDYALVGYYTTVDCCTVGYTGPDTSNRRVGGPGNSTMKWLTGNWFVRLSNATGKPCIPIINAANAPATTIDGVTNDGAAATVVTSIFALLRK
jgi:hypothetical protein